MKRSALGSIVVVVLAVLGACGGGSSGDAPVVSNLALTPLTVPVGAATAITGSMMFSDADGDVDLIAAAITFAGNRTEITPSPIQITGETPTSGTVTVALSLAPPAAGVYDLEIWIIDEGDHDSNKLSVAVTAQ